MVDDFIARKQGKTEIKYELPQLEPILADTYGVIAYQEQVMRIASVLAGFTLGESDLLRKAMGKKKADVMQAQREKFIDGARPTATTRRRPPASST
jgi:DNA polymerase III subunit alpha